METAGDTVTTTGAADVTTKGLDAVLDGTNVNSPEAALDGLALGDAELPAPV